MISCVPSAEAAKSHDPVQPENQNKPNVMRTPGRLSPVKNDLEHDIGPVLGHHCRVSPESEM